jgi:WD40 repeat protein
MFICLYRGHYRSIHAVAFSPDGSRLAVASGDCLISIWDTSTKIGDKNKIYIKIPPPLDKIKIR